ncbi:hypothetical protein V8F33_012200 [Rhypophila sp. PSN 637]
MPSEKKRNAKRAQSEHNTGSKSSGDSSGAGGPTEKKLREALMKFNDDRLLPLFAKDDDDMDTLDALRKALMENTERLLRETAQRAPAIRRDWPNVSRDAFWKMLGPEFSEDWTEEDEAALSAEWEADSTREVILQLGDTDLQELATVWSIVVQYFKCLPTDIIGPETRLTCADGANTPAWSSEFCEALSRILIHELWDHADKGPLIVALEFAVIVRTDDRRPWNLRNPTMCLFVGKLLEKVAARGALPRAERLSTAELAKEAKAYFKREKI